MHPVPGQYPAKEHGKSLAVRRTLGSGVVSSEF
jgi:hypothetical protein